MPQMRERMLLPRFAQGSTERTCNHGFVCFGLRQSVRIGRMHHRLRRSQEPGSYLHRAGAQDQCRATPRASAIPPVAMTGTFTESTTCGKSATRPTI